MADQLPFPIDSTQTDAKSPIDVALMDSLRLNQEFLCDEVFSGKAGSVSGAALALGSVGKILVGGDTNLGIYRKRRFSVSQNQLVKGEGFDPDGQLETTRVQGFDDRDNEQPVIFQGETNYFGLVIFLPADSEWSFRTIEGENFFVIGQSNSWTGVDVLIDGQTPTSLGLTDQDGNAVPDTLVGGNQSKPRYFFGLDTHPHEITIKENGGGGFSYIEAGFAEPSPTLNTDLTIEAGAAAVRGSEVDFLETQVSFSQSQTGHTGSVVCDSDGVITALDGVSPAMTHLVSEKAVSFSSPVTSLQVKSVGQFPDKGICFYQTSQMTQAIFSYASKSDTSVQNQTLDDIIWQTQPGVDFTPDDDLSATNNRANGSANVHYWADAPIEITAGNQNLDFEITENGVTTQHTVAIDTGMYSADLVPFGEVVAQAMESINSISGRYYCKYNAESQRWAIGTISSTVTEINFLWFTGANAGSSVGTVLGFDLTADSEGSTSYTSTEERQHLAAKALQEGFQLLDPRDPRIKYSCQELRDASEAFLNYGIATTNVNKMPVVSYFLNNTFNRCIIIHPEPDACGLTCTFVGGQSGFTPMITAYIDGTESTMFINPMFKGTINPQRERVLNGFLSFPRGSKNIILKPEVTTAFTQNTNGEIYFAGARQWFSKPAWEKLTLNQSIIRSVDVAPISQYRTEYASNPAGLYSPQPANDQINSVTEIGAGWNSTTGTGWAGAARFNVFTGTAVDVNFTLQGNGGGFEFKIVQENVAPRKVQLFISQVGINEGTDLVMTRCANANPNGVFLNPNILSIMGLKAGTYTCRIKWVDTVTVSPAIAISAFNVIDTVHPQSQLEVVTDAANTGQGVPWALYHRKAPQIFNDKDRTPQHLFSTVIKAGRPNVSHFRTAGDGRFIGGTNLQISEVNQGLLEAPYNVTVADGLFGDAASEAVMYAKSVFQMHSMLSTTGHLINTEVDGTTTGSYVANNVVAGGGSSIQSFTSDEGPLVNLFSNAIGMQKLFEIFCAFSAGDTFLVADTTGIIAGRAILLDDGTNTEPNVVLSVVANTSFTVTSPRSVVVDANVDNVIYSGLHSTFTDTTGTGNVPNLCYEPLPLAFSNALNRLAPEIKTEVAAEEHFDLLGGFPNPPQTIFLTYPVHSDGTVGTFLTTAISCLRLENANTFYEINTNFTVTVEGGNVDLLAKSTKEVITNLENII